MFMEWGNGVRKIEKNWSQKINLDNQWHKKHAHFFFSFEYFIELKLQNKLSYILRLYQNVLTQFSYSFCLVIEHAPNTTTIYCIRFAQSWIVPT
jgi:hypothetical protein